MAIRKFRFLDFYLGASVCLAAITIGIKPEQIVICLWAWGLINLAVILTKWIAKKWRGEKAGESDNIEIIGGEVWINRNGNLEHIDGPAVVLRWIDGRRYSEAEFNQILQQERT